MVATTGTLPCATTISADSSIVAGVRVRVTRSSPPVVAAKAQGHVLALGILGLSRRVRSRRDRPGCSEEFDRPATAASATVRGLRASASPAAHGRRASLDAGQRCGRPARSSYSAGLAPTLPRAGWRIAVLARPDLRRFTLGRSQRGLSRGAESHPVVTVFEEVGSGAATRPPAHPGARPRPPPRPRQQPNPSRSSLRGAQ